MNEASPAAAAAQEAAEARAARHRRRAIWLAAIPVLTVTLALCAAYLLESRPLAGMAALLGTLSWVLVFAANLGDDIPPRTNQSSSGINFGRR